MEIEEVKTGDIPRLSLLFSTIYRANYSDHWLDNDPSVYIDEQYSINSLIAQLAKNSKYFIAINQGDVIGFMKINFNKKPILDKKIKL